MPSYPDDSDIILPFSEQPSRPTNWRRIGLLLTLLFCGFLLVHNVVPLYTDWLWFGEVGYTRVFSTVILAKSLLFAVFGALFFAVFYGNVAFARRHAPEYADRFLMEHFGPKWGSALQRGIGWILFGITLFFSLWAGRIAAENWGDWLQFLNWTPFNIKDPVFGNDVGFYIFRQPFFEFLYHFGLITLVMTFLAVIVIHIADRAIETWAGLPDTHPSVRAQLLALLAGLLVILAFGTRLNAYELLTSANGVFYGAGYADIHYRLFARNIQIVLLVLTALACLVSIARKRDFRWPTLGVGAWLLAVVLGGVIPGIGQKVSVDPNQLAMEQKYIAQNIQFTRQGFGLDKVRVVDDFPADDSLTVTQLRDNRDTIENVRLWDYSYLGRIYGQNQTVKTFYRFEQRMVGGTTSANVDIDRYQIGGRTRQVMLAARELNPDGLTADAQNWQNKRLGYTHGYGLVMSPVNTKTSQGGPTYFLQGFPPTASPEAANLKVTQPKIYYGQLAYEYVFVNTTQEEFDPLMELKGVSKKNAGPTAYEGRGGIRIGDSPLAKLAFSVRLGDANVMLSKGFKPTTRVLFRRDIRERVQMVAPFVQQDNDPYLVLTDEGRLVWMIDCYTLSDRYPYSTPQKVMVNPVTFIAPNYIRNSVKAVVDAYDGAVTLYLADPNDPIARTYGKIFPGLLKPLDTMPSGLRAHIRYPEDLFRLQRSVYATYHVDDPGVFFRKEDAWAIPVEPNTEHGITQPRQIEPYYVIMRLPDTEPGESRYSTPGSQLQEEFLLMSPLAPLRQEERNILGWMCARCDGENYGELVLFHFPQEKSVAGPAQVISLLNGDTTISQQLTLLRNAGSTATFGNLLVIPLERSLLYIAPLYVESTNTARIPQLQRVAVAFGQRVVMDETLDKALARLFTDYDAPAAPGTTTPPTNGERPPETLSPTVRTLIEEASRQFSAAQQKLKSGDFAGYGTALKDLERALNELKKVAR